MELRGNGVTIRPVVWNDLPTICRWWNDPVVMREVRAEKWKPTLEQIQTRSWPVWRDPGPGQYHLFVICLGNRLIGEIGYIFDEPAQGKASVDIKIGEPSLWGQGLGTEAMELFVSYLFDGIKAEHIIAQSGDWNTRSRRLFEKCGFTETGREWIPPNNIFDGGVGVNMALDKEKHVEKELNC